MFTKEESKRFLVIGAFVLLAIITYHLVDNFQSVIDTVNWYLGVFSPITMGFIIAYIVNIPMKSVERVLFEKSKRIKNLNIKLKLKRAISLLITILMGGVFITVIISFALPQLVDSVKQLSDQIPNYVTSVGIFLSEQFEKMDIDNSIITEIEKIWTRFLDTIASIMLGVANSTGTFITGFVSGVFNAILSTVLAIYMLLSKESLMHTFKKVLLAFTPERFSKAVVKYAKIVDDSFENFIRGQMLEAIVLGVICYIGMVLFNFEYALLISVLVGLTNVIPLFGPYIGAVPSFLLLLMVNPVQAFWFLLYVSILQQIESNLIYPRVVGSSMGISGFWIIVAVVVGNSLFGIIGILLGIPLLSSLYVIIGEITEKRLKRKNIRI